MVKILETINSLVDILSKPTRTLSDRDLAIVALLFPLALLIEQLVERLLDKDSISAKLLFLIYYLLISFRFTQLAYFNLFIIAIIFVSASIFQSLNQIAVANTLAEGGFGLAVIALFQLITDKFIKKSL